MADGGPFGSASVVVFGLAAAITWGAADFGGGLTSRRAPLFGVVLVTQAVGIVLASVLAVARGEPFPAAEDIGWSALAGLLGVVGILGLYGGLAVGRMGVVAPVTGVLAALVPVSIGIVVDGVPDGMVLAGMVLAGIAAAIAAVILVSRVPGTGTGRSGIELALVAGVGLGLFTVAITRVQESLVFGPLAIVRIVDATVVTAIALAARQPMRVPRDLAPALLAVGALDMAGNAGLLLAEGTGSLAVASVLTSLYPVTTVLLATFVLRERVTVSHAAGILLAVAAIVLIAAGAA
jgi:drug/metabolite transporter (DMT)-like permease